MSPLQDVKDKIEDDAIEHGWNDAKIQGYLDDGKTPNRVAAIYWQKRAEQTAYLVNISESGSSRSMDSIYPRMLEMFKYYDGLANGEEETGDDPDAKRYIRSYPIGYAGTVEGG